MAVGCLKSQEAVDLLHHCLEDGEIVPGKHFREELAKEHLSFEDAWAVLKSGRIYDPPEADIKTGEWKYRVEGHEPGGEWLAVVLSFKEIDRAYLITVFSIQSRRKPK